MPRVEFEPITPMFERSKTIHSLNRVVTVVIDTLQWWTENNLNEGYHGLFEEIDDRFKIEKVSLLYATFYRMVLNIQKQKI
jgi:hypothetical protein